MKHMYEEVIIEGRDKPIIIRYSLRTTIIKLFD